MELEWPRQSPPQTLCEQEIQTLIEPSGIEAASAELVQEGLANTNYRLLASDGRTYHLRIPQRNPAGLPTEVAVMQRMADRLPIPEVRFWSASPAFLISDWAEGRTLQRIEAAGDRSTVISLGPQLGRMLAALQSETFDRAGFLGPRLDVVEPWPSVYDGLRGFVEHVVNSENCRARAPREILDLVRKAWDRAEADLRRGTEQPCLSHSDFKPSNILIAAASSALPEPHSSMGRVSALLDWEFSHAGTWLLDAGQILRYMGERKRPLAERIEEGLTAGGLRPPRSWVALASTIDTASLCDFLSRPAVSDTQRLAILGLLEDAIGLAERD